MKQLSTIQSVLFGIANYYINDGRDDAVLLTVDYYHNRYTITPDTNSIKVNPDFRADVAQFADDLLARKHGINFARSAVRN